MRLLAALIVGLWLPRAALAQCQCTCDWMPVDCTAAYEEGACLERCGGPAPAPQPMSEEQQRRLEEARRRQEQAQAYQQAVFWAERVHIDLEILERREEREERRQARHAPPADFYVAYTPPAADPPPPPVVETEPSEPEPAEITDACAGAMERLEETQATYTKMGEEYGTDFAKDELAAAAEKIARAGLELTQEAWAASLDALEELSADIEEWTALADAWLACHQREGCDTTALEGHANDEYKALLAEFDDNMAASAERVEKASAFLHDYGQRLAEAQMAHTADAAECLAKPAP